MKEFVLLNYTTLTILHLQCWIFNTFICRSSVTKFLVLQWKHRKRSDPWWVQRHEMCGEVNDVVSLCFAPKALFIPSYTCELSTSTSTWPLVVVWVTACKMCLCHHRLSRIHRGMRNLGKVWLIKPYLLSQICVHFLASLSLCRESDNGNSTTAGATEALLCCPQKVIIMTPFVGQKEQEDPRFTEERRGKCQRTKKHE